IVHSGKLVSKVLGTSFNVSAYPKDKNIDIMVVSGKVAVNRNGIADESVELEKNEKVSFSKNKSVLIKTRITNTSEYLSWKNGKITFYHTPMTEVAKVLYRNFGLNISYENEKLAAKKIS